MQGKATFKGHPIHPMLVPFPIAFWVGSLIADILHFMTPAGYALSVLAILALMYLGWLGGDLVYDPKVGVEEPADKGWLPSASSSSWGRHAGCSTADADAVPARPASRTGSTAMANHSETYRGSPQTVKSD
jgi:hypothetical protein